MTQDKWLNERLAYIRGLKARMTTAAHAMTAKTP
jgi:hypothetical protein